MDDNVIDENQPKRPRHFRSLLSGVTRQSGLAPPGSVRENVIMIQLSTSRGFRPSYN